jgi:hypothetical protein
VVWAEEVVEAARRRPEEHRERPADGVRKVEAAGSRWRPARQARLVLFRTCTCLISPQVKRENSPQNKIEMG